MAAENHENGLLAIEVDADDYAETAASDAPAVSRTHQSEADFEAIKGTYEAKQDGGKTYQDLIATVPAFGYDATNGTHASTASKGEMTRVRLSKKDFQLLGYAVGELYLDKEYGRILQLCWRVRERCEVDPKAGESLERWERKCRGRLGQS